MPVKNHYLLLEHLERASLLEAIPKAQFVQIDGNLFETEYARTPDEHTKPDDVLLELKSQRDEILFTQKELENAQYLGEGVYQLASGGLIQLLTSATVH